MVIFEPIGDVTLDNSCFDCIVQLSFGITDCGKMRDAGSGQYNSLRPIVTVAPLSSGFTQKNGKIKLNNAHSR